MVMTREQLLEAIDMDRVRKAIEDAERRTSGEIVVSISPLFYGSVEKAARRAFTRLGVAGTRQRNGILFFIVPSRHRFVVLGDQGIHEKAGQELWDKVAAHLSEHFRAGEFTEGLVQGIEEVGEQLSAYFPYDASTDLNELPDDVELGGHFEGQ
jgi:uncharacterized membrane protein